MSESLNVIALISGGKDSLYCILHCLENGHKVVALANLYPKSKGSSTSDSYAKSDKDDSTEGDTEKGEGEGEDLNSFMYQTVGHSVIPLYSECLGLPLYRQEITGSAVQTGRYYDASHIYDAESEPKHELAGRDETEDLATLLQTALKHHPEANAVCSGAILSTYQRTRVESVAVRLGLTPLSYLWQYPALPASRGGRGDSLTGLLDDMSAAGCDARIIKIASGGIREGLLWANVATPTIGARLVKGLRPFFPDQEFELRGAVLGEGGEYETLAINGPRRLWRKRIEVAEEDNTVLVGDGGVSYLQLGSVRVVDNKLDPTTYGQSQEEAEEAEVRIPGSHDPQFSSIVTNLQSQKKGNTPVDDANDHIVEQLESSWKGAELFGGTDHSDPNASLHLVHGPASTRLTVSNITAPKAEIAEGHDENTTAPSGRSGSATDQMEQICQILTSLFDSTSLSSHGLLCKPSSSDIVSTTLLLKDMWNFASVNAVYSSLFRPGEPNPPARVTLATLLPEDVEVSLSVVFDLGPPDARRGLHVQSRSYWAPANIGPYSQAICVPVDGRQRQESETRSHDAGSVEAVHVAGQIPLVPQTMQLSQDGFLNQAALSLQHLWRVGQERSVDIWPWGIAFLKISSRAQSQSRALEAFQIWRQAYEFGRRTNLVPSSEGDSDDDTTEGPDAWDLQFNRFSTRNAEFAEPMSVGKHLHLLPNDSVFLDEVDHCRASFIPPFIAAEVVSLPQDAPIEWWSLGVANLPKKTPTSTPRIKTVRKKCKWGSFCKVSILPPRFADEQDDRSGLNDALLVVHLVTILVDLGPSPIHDDKDDHNIKVIEDDLFNFLCPEAGSERRMAASRLPPRLEVVHGTALVSIEGQMQWSRMMCNQGFFSNLTVIPCRSVVSGPAIDDDLNLDLGRIEFNDKDGDEGSGCDKESSEIFGPGGKIAAGPHAARTPEPQHQVDNTTDSGSKDDRKSTAASGNSHCQPLAVAMTMRIDERP